MDAFNQLVCIRHGQSQWNLENRFTGWADVPLTEKGQSEARQAGWALKDAGFTFDIAYTSVLSRAQNTLKLVLESMDHPAIPVVAHWRLNERHYGGLTGLDKDAMRAKYGEEQVHIWRRSYDVPPPLPETDLSEYPGFEPGRYSQMDDPIPATESLKDTIDRVLPYWQGTIAPKVLQGQRVLIAAHGNSLRALVKHLSQIGDADITQVEIPTGSPFVYDLDANLSPIHAYRYVSLATASA
jgi:2,3-bisphosphoglycerate-dependent phosphoglycerate mutase